MSMTWKEGKDTLITLDGVTTAVTNSYSLVDFTSGEDLHVAGGYPYDQFFFDGTTQNVKVYDTYIDPGGTMPGDANYDGSVDEADASILAENWLFTSGVTWGMGDFNDDGKVDDVDATIMATNWSYGSTSSTLPEPGTIYLLLAVLVSLAVRRFTRCGA